MRPATRAAGLGMALGALATLAGCVNHYDEGGVSVYRMGLWVGGLVGLAGVAAVPGGVALFKNSSKRFGIVLILLGLGASVVLAPALLMDRVEIDSRHFVSRHGFWFSPEVHDVPFDQVASVRRTVEITRGRRGRQNKNFYLDVQMRNGATERVPLGTVMKEAEPELVSRLQERGIPFADTDF